MTIEAREQQILRVKAAGFHQELNETLQETLQNDVRAVVKTTLESALVEEVKASLAEMTGLKPRRSGYFQRSLDTQYGHIRDLQVPKLRQRNGEREWQILNRYQRSLGGLLDWLCCLSVMGLSLRDLQEALYFLIGHVLSRSAVNQVTLKVQQQLDQRRLTPIEKTPKVLIVDGVWVEIQYTTDEFKEDRSGHLRQCRQAQERVILAVLAVWEDGTYEMLHYEVAIQEGEDGWHKCFQSLIARGLDPNAIQLVVSDGTLGLPNALKQNFPHAQAQRCITHKVRGMEKYLSYAELSPVNADGQSITTQESKRQRKFEITQTAYEIYQADTLEQAKERLELFTEQWKIVEPEAVRLFLREIDLTLTFYQFSSELHPHIRTTNHLERLFREFRTKSDELGAFPNETSCLTVFFLVIERDHAKHNRKTMAKNS
jgi:putative transposase